MTVKPMKKKLSRKVCGIHTGLRFIVRLPAAGGVRSILPKKTGLPFMITMIKISKL